jgi:hypothetical protein
MRFQGIDIATLKPDELRMWESYFAEAVERSKTGPKVGLMKIQQVAGEEKYGVALRDSADLWLTLWVRCSCKGEIFIMYPRGDRTADAYASYHLDGTLHQKSCGLKGLVLKRQPITAAFKGSEHLGTYGGHGTSTGAVCDPKAFNGVVIVEPGILGPLHGLVGIDLIEPGYEATWNRDIAARFYFGKVDQQQIFPRDGHPSLAITVQHHAPARSLAARHGAPFARLRTCTRSPDGARG